MTSRRYRAHALSEIRSLFLNLKDKQNPALRNEIVLGYIEADKVVAMSKEVGHASCPCGSTCASCRC